MLIIVLGLLGIPLWFLALTVAVAAWSRRGIKSTEGSFRCKVRVLEDSIETSPKKWTRRRGVARWIHDVLLEHRGPALLRTVPRGVVAVGSLRHGTEVGRGLGERPCVATLRLDDGASIEVACRAEDARLLTGPFPVHASDD
jgi:hypothetical protein